jgi:hypothetical protein
MNKLISTLMIVVLSTAAFAGTASAGPGNGNQNPQMGGQQGPQINFNLGGKIPAMGNGQSYGGGETTSPGDAFYPDTSRVGAPRSKCDRAGGRTVRQVIDGNLVVLCVL